MSLIRATVRGLRTAVPSTPTTCTQLLRASAPTLKTTSTLRRSAAAPFSTSPARLGGGHHGPEFDPPTGWLWGLRPGEKYEREGWEMPMTLAGVAFAVFVVVLAFKPDTSLDTWALEEARRRLEKEGILPDPFPESTKKN